MIKAVWTNDVNSKIHKDALKIRHQVFIEEQEFPPGSDVDDLENQCEHLVLYDENEPVATARIFNEAKNVYRIERVAVLKKARKTGLGAKLMKELEKQIKKNGANKITLNSQEVAFNFYKKLDYHNVGDEFLDYDVLHQRMEKNI